MRTGEIIDGRFELDRPLGAGGMGQVYLARDLTSGAPVAFKVLLDTSASDPQRFAREVELLASLKIPGVVRYIARGTTAAKRPYLVMEWLEGETLVDRLTRGPLGITESVALARRVAEILAAIHRCGVVHRDLKPGNLLLVGGEVERVTLLDFGVAHAAGLDFAQLTIPGTVLGTPAYMAPEQARGAASVDARADLFALGCVLYECIAGRPPFFAVDVLSLLMKVIIEEPPRLQTVRAGVPGWLDALIARLLAKAPAERPTDAGAVAALLAAPERIPRALPAWRPEVSVQAATAPVEVARKGDPGTQSVAAPGAGHRDREGSSRPPPSGTAGPSRHITAGERKVLCLIVAELQGSPGETGAERADARQRTRALGEVVGHHGAALDVLQGRWLLVVISGASAPTDLAARAARCALAMQGLVVGMPIAVATGRAEAEQPATASELIARAVRLLDGDRGCAEEAAIRLDEVTAPLLEQRFDVVQDAAGQWLAGVRDELSTMRRLLGKPTAFVGRDRELAVLMDELESCIEERTARSVLITGPAGSGKSRLRHEFLSRLRAGNQGVEVWTGHGDPMSAGSAFALLSSALRRAFDFRDGEPPDERRRKVRARVERSRTLEAPRIAAFLGELVGVPFPEDGQVQLQAARRDPMLMGDQLRLAWEEFAQAECAARPVLLVLEDLHWGDLPTISFVDATLAQLRALPFLVLALARPEVHDVFPGLWKDRYGHQFRLSPLPRRASEKLVRQTLGDAVSDELVARLAERADGNAFFLEELIRSASTGEDAAFPETVLAMAQARIEALPPEERRVLRAASLFGQSFRRSGVAEIAGDADVAGELASLERRELITRRGVEICEGEVAYRFRHALLREAAHGMLTDRDRRRGHALAGDWLERTGDTDPMALAEHFSLGGEPARAARAFLRAAEQALRGDDLAAAIERAERGMLCAPEPETAGALRGIQAEAHNWRGEFALAEERGGEAVELLPDGSARWFSAIQQVTTATAKLGAIRSVERWSGRALEASPREGARDEQNICLGEGAFCLAICGSYGMADALLEAIEPAMGHADRVAPEALARFHQARAIRWLSTGDLESSLRSLEAALAGFEQTGDRRNACTTRTNLAFVRGELGDFSGAESLLRGALAAAEQMGLDELIAVVQRNLGSVLTCSGKLAEAESFSRTALKAFQRMGSPRAAGDTQMDLARLALLTGDIESAEREARAAVETLEVAPPLRPIALAILARALLGQGRRGEALAAAGEAHASIGPLGGIEKGESLIRLTYAEALAAAGHLAEAARAITSADAALLARADKLREPRWREIFLGEIPEHARTRELARRWRSG